jgi:nucleotide-binding universal stress UspA family protein
MAADSLFRRVLCCLDTTPEADEGARQAARLAPPGSALVLLGVTQPAAAAPPGFGVLAVPLLEARRELESALERADAELGAVHRVESRLLEGAPIPTLLRAAREESATLVAVGSHGRSRAAGIALGSVATALLHDAPASVLVARPTEAAGWPRSIAVGVDGSPPAFAALEAAQELARRLGAALRGVCALGGKSVDLDSVQRQAAGLPVIEDARNPVDALVDAGADLIVVGSRGLHGLRALGSVSERVAHRASASVLVVRVQAPVRRNPAAP